MPHPKGVNSHGYLSHKNPDCKCNGCSARRREAEAFTSSIGARGDALATTEGKVGRQLKGRVPRGKSLEDRVAQWTALRALHPGITNKEVAEHLEVSYSHINNLLCKAGKLGLLKAEDSLVRLRHEIIPKAMDNLSEFLDQKDHTATIETMKGTAFPAFREAEGVRDAPQTILALKIEAIDPEQVKVISGHIVGKAKDLTE